jgi:hypothetical protein
MMLRHPADRGAMARFTTVSTPDHFQVATGSRMTSVMARSAIVEALSINDHAVPCDLQLLKHFI